MNSLLTHNLVFYKSTIDMIVTCLIKQASLMPIELCDQRSQQRKEGFWVQKNAAFSVWQSGMSKMTTQLISPVLKLSRVLPSIFSATTGNCWGHGTWRVSRNRSLYRQKLSSRQSTWNNLIQTNFVFVFLFMWVFYWQLQSFLFSLALFHLTVM